MCAAQAIVRKMKGLRQGDGISRVESGEMTIENAEGCGYCLLIV